MAWDPTRPVPWRRLVREWLVYVGIMAVVFVAFFRDDGLIGVLAGLLASGPLYLGFGYVLAKFGYQRKTLREMRAETRPTAREASSGSDLGPKPKPPPTKRTGAPGGKARRPSR